MALQNRIIFIKYPIVSTNIGSNDTYIRLVKNFKYTIKSNRSFIEFSSCFKNIPIMSFVSLKLIHKIIIGDVSIDETVKTVCLDTFIRMKHFVNFIVSFKTSSAFFKFLGAFASFLRYICKYSNVRLR